jgi:hypothetical protein
MHRNSKFSSELELGYRCEKEMFYVFCAIVSSLPVEPSKQFHERVSILRSVLVVTFVAREWRTIRSG